MGWVRVMHTVHESQATESQATAYAFFNFYTDHTTRANKFSLRSREQRSCSRFRNSKAYSVNLGIFVAGSVRFCLQRQWIRGTLLHKRCVLVIVSFSTVLRPAPIEYRQRRLVSLILNVNPSCSAFVTTRPSSSRFIAVAGKSTSRFLVERVSFAENDFLLFLVYCLVALSPLCSPPLPLNTVSVVQLL